MAKKRRAPRPIPSQRFFPDVPDLRKVIDEGVKFFRTASDKQIRALLHAALEEDEILVPNNTRVKRVKALAGRMTNQDIADRLKPIARHNRYARKLLKAARKKGLVK